MPIFGMYWNFSRRKRWRYPGVPIPSRLDHVYWDYSKGLDPNSFEAAQANEKANRRNRSR